MFATRITAIARTATAAGLIGLTALGAATIAAAEPASTTVQDKQFLTGLTAEGITYTSPEHAIRLAHGICSEFADGSTFEAAFTGGRQNNSSLTDQQIEYTITHAVTVYCPQYSDQLPA
ncbi:DUF732 domain-containing protein [Rhodococcus aetherivorans]